VVDLLVAERCFGSGLAITIDVLTTTSVLSAVSGGPPVVFDCSVRSLDGQPVASSTGQSIAVEGRAGERRADVVLVFGPGMADVGQVLADLALPASAELIVYLQQAAAEGAFLGASCASAFLLAESGVLEGGPATTSWWLAPAFRARYPAVRLVEEEIVVGSRRAVTAGAALAQIDLALHVARLFAGAELGQSVARYLLFDDSRREQGPFARVSHFSRHDPLVANVEAILRADLASPPDFEVVARKLGVTSRTLARRFVATTGLPPASFLRRLRLEFAAGLLRSTREPTAHIAARVGYDDERAFRRAFTKDMKASPSHFRRNS
jgi:transcriptional regulator GlxA family with amidase domain